MRTGIGSWFPALTTLRRSSSTHTLSRTWQVGGASYRFAGSDDDDVERFSLPSFPCARLAPLAAAASDLTRFTASRPRTQ